MVINDYCDVLRCPIASSASFVIADFVDLSLSHVDLRNTVSVVGWPVTFTCDYDPADSLGVPLWTFHSAANHTQIVINNESRVRNELLDEFRLFVNNTTGQTELTIESVRLSHSGTYGCTRITKDGVSSTISAELLVLGNYEPVFVLLAL